MRQMTFVMGVGVGMREATGWMKDCLSTVIRPPEVAAIACICWKNQFVAAPMPRFGSVCDDSVCLVPKLVSPSIVARIRSGSISDMIWRNVASGCCGRLGSPGPGGHSAPGGVTAGSAARAGAAAPTAPAVASVAEVVRNARLLKPGRWFAIGAVLLFADATVQTLQGGTVSPDAHSWQHQAATTLNTGKSDAIRARSSSVAFLSTPSKNRPSSQPHLRM